MNWRLIFSSTIELSVNLRNKKKMKKIYKLNKQFTSSSLRIANIDYMANFQRNLFNTMNYATSLSVRVTGFWFINYTQFNGIAVFSSKCSRHLWFSLFFFVGGTSTTGWFYTIAFKLHCSGGKCQTIFFRIKTVYLNSVVRSMYTKYCEINAMWNWLCGLYSNLGNDSFFWCCFEEE